MLAFPYPAHLAKTQALPSGVEVFVRPVTPGDEELLQNFVRCLDPRDARFRFFAPVHELSHVAAARLTRVDYKADMGMVAFPSVTEQREILGIAWFFTDEALQTAEFAICVQSAHRGEGLGLLLMRDMIHLAQQQGIKALWGDVLSDNRRMLDMCAELGMTRSNSPLDAGIVRVTLDLNNK